MRSAVLMTVWLSGGLTAALVAAQEVGRARMEQTMAPEPLADWSAPGALDREIDSLQEQRRAASDSMYRTQQPTRVRDGWPGVTSLRDRLEKSDRKLQPGYDDINRRLDLLESLLHRLSTAPPQQAIPLPLTAPRQPEDVEPPIEQAAEPPADPVPPADPPPELPEPEVPEIITNNAVDRLALADNLFASGNIRIALKLYIELESAEHEPETKQWIKYQIASCSRRLGDLDTTRKHLRWLAGIKSETLYPRLARWWLDAIHKREKYEANLRELRERIDIREPANESKQA